MHLKSVGIIGYGSFGQLAHRLLTRFAPSIRVRVFSRSATPDQKTFFSLNDVCLSDAVILSVPIHEIESVLKQILPLLKPETVIVDIATVKVHTCNLLARHAKGHRYIASHPMFGPESYEKSSHNVKGFRIVVTKHTLEKKEYAALLNFLKVCGFDIVEMTPKRHDRHLSETLFLTHFIGQTIGRAGFTHTEIDTVSFRFLMDAVESVKNDTALFKDVFRFNPFCEDTLVKLERAESGIHSLLRTSIRKHLKNED